MSLYKHVSKHMAVALRVYYKNVKDLTDQIELHFIEEVNPGYFWIFPIEENYANIGIGMLHHHIKKQKIDLKKCLNNAINSDAFKNRFSSAEPLEKPIGYNLPFGSIKRKIYGNGFMLLGDAAGLIDPFTGEGIGNAMCSSKHAINAAKESLTKQDFSEKALQFYDHNLFKEIGRELKISNILQKVIRFRSVVNFAIKKIQNNKKARDLISNVLTNNG